MGGGTLPQLNDAIAWAAHMNLDDDHLFDAVNVFDGHPICSGDPYVNGFTLGDDQLGIVGNESFHPNSSGNAALFAGAAAKWGPTLGAFPNDPHYPAAKSVSAAAGASAPVGPPAARRSGRLRPRRPARPSRSSRSSKARCAASGRWSSGGPGTVTVHGGPANTDLRVTMEPLAAVVGSGRTDASGTASIPIAVGASAAPGEHLLTVWAGNDRVDLTAGFSPAPRRAWTCPTWMATSSPTPATPTRSTARSPTSTATAAPTASTTAR